MSAPINPFCSEKGLKLVANEGGEDLKPGPKIEPELKSNTSGIVTSEQIGHGDEPVPYNKSKMDEVLEKMRHPLYKVEKVDKSSVKKSAKRKSESEKKPDEKKSKQFKWY